MGQVVKLASIEQGQGQPLVLLHGYPLSRAIWEPLLPTLSQHFRVILPDLRGHGQSPAPDGAYTMDDMAADVLHLLAGLNIQQAFWAGHSMGGYVMLAALRQQPAAFLGMAMVATQHLPDSPEAKANRYKAVEGVREKGAEAVVGLVDKLFAAGTPDTLREQARQMILLAAPEGIIGTLQAMAERPDSTATLQGLTFPAVVIGGAEDQIIKPEVVQAAAGLIPGAALVMIDGAGHMPSMEQPAATAEALLRLKAQ